jgi:hypothetical protein
MIAMAQKCIDTHYIARHIEHFTDVIHVYKNSRLASTSRLRGRPSIRPLRRLHAPL